MPTIAENVQKAIDEMLLAFPGTALTTEPDGSGGARVMVEPVLLSPIYLQKDTWIGGHIPVQIPYADVYPLFVRGDLTRANGTALGEAMATGQMFMNRSAVQVSRRSNARDPQIETPAMKFIKVINWIRSRP